MFTFGRNKEVLCCATNAVPVKYWVDSGEVDTEGKVILVNDWIAMIGPKPLDGRDYEAQSDGTWLDITTIEDIRLSRQSEIKEECQDYIYGLYSKEKQLSMSLGVYSTEITDAATQTISLCIDEENRLYSLIESSTDEEEIQGFTPVWPEKIEPII